MKSNNLNNLPQYLEHNYQTVWISSAILLEVLWMSSCWRRILYKSSAWEHTVSRDLQVGDLMTSLIIVSPIQEVKK